MLRHRRQGEKTTVRAQFDTRIRERNYEYHMTAPLCDASGVECSGGCGLRSSQFPSRRLMRVHESTCGKEET